MKISLSNGAAQCAYVIVSQLRKPEPEDFFTSASIAVHFRGAKILLPLEGENNAEYQRRSAAWVDKPYADVELTDPQELYLKKAFQELQREKKLDGNEFFGELGMALNLDKK